ncbi:putative peptide-N4-(N-acetyl-beta-glucosaminyl)asparagine amidase A [Phyllosticta citrichinensis]|uniref:Peptide-N4-(N-acetyl-beta-glucosaminyl)asparagine amidase A n=1 Tax=Phyllosticta citrichinensis TaxID=1130410 RepID=A0ABR1Y666_9PEZI
MHGAAGSRIAPPIRTATAPRSNLLLLLLLAALLSALPAAAAAANRRLHQQALAIRAENASTSPLDVVELDPPVLTPKAPDCQDTLMVHVFGQSYGKPYVGEYAPPACEFNRVVFNLTVTSRGRQYDRLAIMYFNDTEIFRTSTAEPTADGIIWAYIKDMSAYVSLFKEPQKIIFDLGNLLSDVYTGSFNITLIASFYNDADATFKPADAILPVSAAGSSTDSGSAFTLPADVATNTLTIPANVERAIFSIAACGQAEEEFWMSSVPNSLVDTFGDVTELYGFWPFRELQLLIDGNLAGVAWPFPIVFTGGVVASFWRPLVGIDAFDLKEDQIDVTPWLGLLSDGAEHTFEIRVTGLNETGPNTAILSETVNSNWVVTGKLFLWCADSNSSGATTGTQPTVSAPSPSIRTWYDYGGLSANGTNSTLEFAVDVSRSLSVSATINGAPHTWTQELHFSNYNNYSAAGTDQLTIQNTSIHDALSRADATAFSRQAAYPLTTFVHYVSTAALTYLGGSIDRAKSLLVTGSSAFPLGLAGFDVAVVADGTRFSTRQNATGDLTITALPASASSRSDNTRQDLAFAALLPGGEVVPLFEAQARAVNGSWVVDSGSDEGRESLSESESQSAFAPKPLHEMLGHGPPRRQGQQQDVGVGVGARVAVSKPKPEPSLVSAPLPLPPASAAERRRARGAGEL